MTDTVVVDDVRRLTGPNILSRAPLVVLDVVCTEAQIEPMLAAYLRELGRLRAALGLPELSPTTTRRSKAGATFGYPAPPDVMLACAEMTEWAAHAAAAAINGSHAASLETLVSFDAARETFAAMLATARNANMTALVDEAAKRDVPFLWDDTDVTVGAGHASRTYANAEIPPAADVPWSDVARIPTALVTGTNGKTTSTRFLAYVMRAATPAKVVGVASSDGVIVGADVLERGDWSGPAAARRVLRHHKTEVAVLETARGGILRRGLALADCHVALLTNVSADHLGGYGVDDVTAMAEVKAVVARAARSDADGGTAILNARDPYLVALGTGPGKVRAAVTFFADLEAGGDVSAAAAVIGKHREAKGSVVFTRGGSIVAVARGSNDERVLVSVDDVPITFRGAARYNVENALGVVGAAVGMGVDDATLVRALRAFGSDDNPRRGQLIERRGVRVFLDFGHNPEAVRAAMGVVSQLRKTGDGTNGRLTVVTASPGDRSNDDMITVAHAVMQAKPDQIYVRDLPHYLRGRAPGEVPAIFESAFRDRGLAAGHFHIATSEVDALEAAFGDAKAGDVIAVLVHLDTDDVRAFLDSLLDSLPAG